MQDLINKFETLLMRDKVEKCKQVKIASYFVKEKYIFTVVLLYSLCLLVHLPRHAQVCQRLSHDIFFFFRPIQPLINESSKSCYLEFSPGVIQLSRSRELFVWFLQSSRQRDSAVFIMLPPQTFRSCPNGRSYYSI